MGEWRPEEKEKQWEKPTWLKVVWKVIGGVAFILAVVNDIQGFSKLWREEAGLLTYILLTVGIVCPIGYVGYLVFAKKASPVVPSRRIWKYPDHARHWAIAFLGAIPLLTAVTFGAWIYWRNLPPDKLIVLIANFDGPELEKYRVTETILSQLRKATGQYEDVEIVALGEAITEEQGSAVARAVGKRRKATIVIWGWYGATEQVAPISVHFELLHEPKYMPDIGLEAQGLVQVIPVAGLESFELQLNLSDEMSYLTLFAVGMTRLAVESYQDAIACFSDTLSQTAEPVQALDQSVVYFYRGFAYDNAGNYEYAMADYDQAIYLDPSFAAAYINRGAIYDQKHDSARAIADYDQAILLAPSFPQAYVNRGAAYDHAGDYKHAIADYNQAIQLNSNLALAYVNRGVTYGHVGNYDRAISDYDQAIYLDPSLALAYRNRGLTYDKAGQYDRAIADFDQVISLGSHLADAYYNRGNAYSHAGNYEHAIADYDQVVRLDPNFAQGYHNRGFAYSEVGNYNHAIADYSQAIQLDPNLAQSYYNRGNVYNEMGDYEHAIVDFDQAIRLDPNFVQAYVNRGAAYGQAGDYDRAIVDYDQAIYLDSNFALAYYNRGIAYKYNGEKEKAIADFKKVLELDIDQSLQQQAEQQLKELGAK